MQMCLETSENLTIGDSMLWGEMHQAKVRGSKQSCWNVPSAQKEEENLAAGFTAVPEGKEGTAKSSA